MNSVIKVNPALCGSTRYLHNTCEFGFLNFVWPSSLCFNDARKRHVSARAMGVTYSGKMRSSRSVAEVSILRLCSSRGLNVRGCRLPQHRGVMPWWRRRLYATIISNLHVISWHQQAYEIPFMGFWGLGRHRLLRQLGYRRLHRRSDDDRQGSNIWRVTKRIDTVVEYTRYCVKTNSKLTNLKIYLQIEEYNDK